LSSLLYSLRDTLTKIEADEGDKKEFTLYKGRILSSLSDIYVKRKLWEEAEGMCLETIKLFESSFAGQDDTLNSNLGIQYYQLAVVKRNLKKLEEAVECNKTAYDYVTKSKLKAEFASAIARQRSDVLDALGRFDEAKVVMLDHIERIEALQKASESEKKDGEDVDENDENPSQTSPKQVSAHNLTDNMLFLARLHFEHEEYEASIDYLKKAYEIVPSPYYLSMLASAQFEAGLNDDALATQSQLKKLRPGGEMPISSSRFLLTKTHHLRQAKADGDWTVNIQVENKPVVPLGSEMKLKPGTLIECFVRRHYDADEAVTEQNNSVGPFIYIVKGDEVDNCIIIKGHLLKKLESSKIYEIVLNIYASQQDKSQKLGSHRQLARALSFNTIQMSRMMGENYPAIVDELSEDLDDYALPEPREREEEFVDSFDEEEETIMADESVVAAVPSSSSSSSSSSNAQTVHEPISAATQATTTVQKNETVVTAPAVSAVVVEAVVEDKIVVVKPVAIEAVEAVVVENVVAENIVAEPVVVEVVEAVVAEIVAENVVIAENVVAEAVAVEVVVAETVVAEPVVAAEAIVAEAIAEAIAEVVVEEEEKKVVEEEEVVNHVVEAEKAVADLAAQSEAVRAASADAVVADVDADIQSEEPIAIAEEEDNKKQAEEGVVVEPIPAAVEAAEEVVQDAE
jgi:tetratricopeptide (TPR) repeat protein